jgi:predicted SAM-dependent methyltransferase
MRESGMSDLSAPPLPGKLKINLCSGQRPFGDGWLNVDCQEKYVGSPNFQLADALHTGLPGGCASLVVIHHGLEHFDIQSADSLIQECYRLLHYRGSVIITVPDLDTLTYRWRAGMIDDYTFCVNLHGAYMGDPADLHRWSYTRRTLRKKLLDAAKWRDVVAFNHRQIPGADIAQDWWILGLEAVK